MNDQQIRLATCKIICADKLGTGWLIAPDKVLTAYHCVTPAIDSGKPISLKFGEGVDEGAFASVIAYDVSLDVCILLLPNAASATPVALATMPPREGAEWHAFGHPAAKYEIGHRLEGRISLILDEPKMAMDLDLVVQQDTALTDYQGLSGAALMCGPLCYGMLRIAVDRALGAISVMQMAQFLKKNQIDLELSAEPENASAGYAERPEFLERFEATVAIKSSGYLFLEGAPGIGKTTFCDEFRPEMDQVELAGTYSFACGARGANATLRIQPEVFHDWLNTVVSLQSSGKPARLSEMRYSEFITHTAFLLDTLAKRYIALGKVGVLFVDGMNEAAAVGAEAFAKFIGLFPVSLHQGLVIVFTGPSYAHVAASLGNRLGPTESLQMPALEWDVATEFCKQELETGRANPSLITQICERAQGHPLYLHYLIDYVNGGATDEELVVLPTFSGSIRAYYEVLWTQLLSDGDAVNLLGIMARLRWGIPMEQFANILKGSERAVFVPTTTRIRHLLLSPENTAAYHTSFSDFLVEKTGYLERSIQVQLADYCRAQQATDYGLLNVIYHSLRAGDAEKAQAIHTCQQDWIDQCVTHGADPDTLLSDIEEALVAATQGGTAVEIVRLLLIQQRVHFRYNTLFALHAGLAAKALIALGKSREALQHSTRYGHLIVQPAHALGLALQLTQAGEKKVAIDILRKAEHLVVEALSKHIPEVERFLELVHLRIHVLAYTVFAGSTEAVQRMTEFYRLVSGYLERLLQGDVQEFIESLMAGFFGDFFGTLMCLQGRYVPLLKFPAFSSKSPEDMLEIFVRLLNSYHLSATNNNLPVNCQMIAKVFDDMTTVLERTDEKPLELVKESLDTLILLGAPAKLVSSLAEKDCLRAAPPEGIFDISDVSVDIEGYDAGIRDWRVSSFLQAELQCPKVAAWDEGAWQARLENVAKALAWCDGSARRANVDGDASDLQRIGLELEATVLQPLQRLSLIQRVKWEDSYAIPEEVIPRVYSQLLTLCLDCYPERVSDILLLLDERFSDQCGIYSEGFRSTLLTMLGRLSQADIDGNDSDSAFALAERFSEYVRRNVKNRHELVPDLLRLIPIFTRLDATEFAHDIYQVVLSVSMGPGWYKESQLTLMTRALMRFPASEPLAPHVLPNIATYLESASGEMTFQQYVRNNKAELLGEMCRRGLYADAIRYFQRQTCGSPEQLFIEACEGDIDRPSRLRGMRFPGGSLNEQDSISQMLNQTGSNLTWQISWALLEIFQHGDSNDARHWGAAYARLIERNGSDSVAITLMLDRMRIISKAEINPDQRQEFLQSFHQHLDARNHQAFASVLSDLDSADDDNSHENVVSGNPFSDKSTEQGESVTANEAEGNLDKDLAMMPGLFGRSSASSEAENSLKRARSHLSKRNWESAKTEAVNVLKAFQDGDWPIWGELSDTAREAERILGENSKSADSLARQYAPLVVAERFAEKWRIAEHLIGRIAGLLTAEDRTLVAECVLEHVRLILACEDDSLASYQLMDGSGCASASESFLELILWLIDHPLWGRRDKAAELVTWLVDSYPDGTRFFVLRAFSNGSGGGADILCGALDSLSLLQPLELWSRIEPFLDLANIGSSCQHAGRMAVLLRIANRAEGKGAESASSALLTLRAKVRGKSETQTPLAIDRLPSWAISIKFEWEELDKLGLATQEVADIMIGKLAQECAPLDIDTVWQLEGLVCEAFRVNPHADLNRWNAKLRYALHTSVYPFSTEPILDSVEQVLRVYNPNPLRSMRRLAFTSPSALWMSRLQGKAGAKFSPVSGAYLYLDFREVIMQRARPRLLEVTAFLFPTSQPVRPISPFRKFRATEIPNTDDYKAGEVCASVNATGALLGVFTPAVPLPGFVHLSRTSMSDFDRFYWRNGRTPLANGSFPMSEGCCLLVRREALQLPYGWSMGWLVKLDGKNVCVLS